MSWWYPAKVKGDPYAGPWPKIWYVDDPYQNGPWLHREDKPSMIAEDGREIYCLNNKAWKIIEPDGTELLINYLDEVE